MNNGQYQEVVYNKPAILFDLQSSTLYLNTDK